MGMKYIECYRLIPTETKNNRQIPVTTYIKNKILGYIGSSSNNLVKIAGMDTIETRFKFFCNDFSLKEYDLIEYQNKTYEVVGEPKNTAHRNHHLKCVVRKIDKIKQNKGV